MREWTSYKYGNNPRRMILKNETGDDKYRKTHRRLAKAAAEDDAAEAAVVVDGDDGAALARRFFAMTGRNVLAVDDDSYDSRKPMRGCGKVVGGRYVMVAAQAKRQQWKLSIVVTTVCLFLSLCASNRYVAHVQFCNDEVVLSVLRIRVNGQKKPFHSEFVYTWNSISANRCNS